MARPTRAALTRLARSDTRLAAAMKHMPTFPGFPQRGTQGAESHYAYLARSIVFQQLAGKAASTIHGRVCALTPGARFPRPPELLRLSEKRLRGAGLSGNKLASLRDLAERVERGELNLSNIARVSDERIIERLVGVRGIGVWTVQMFLMFRLGRLDVMPIGDLGVQEGLRQLDGLADRPTPTMVQERSEVWAPLRSVASWTLWRLADAAKPAPKPKTTSKR
jgi:3-methyladenine DNA glycosylase/8-oxoguanine DNA glycosylase